MKEVWHTHPSLDQPGRKLLHRKKGKGALKHPSELASCQAHWKWCVQLVKCIVSNLIDKIIFCGDCLNSTCYMCYSFPFSAKDCRTKDELVSTAIKGCTFQRPLLSGCVAGRDQEEVKVAAVHALIFIQKKEISWNAAYFWSVWYQCLNISRYPLTTSLLFAGNIGQRGLSAVDNFDLNHFMSRDYTGSQCQLESTHISVGE